MRFTILLAPMVLTLLMFPGVTFGTSVIAVWLPDKIVLAADSYRKIAGRRSGRDYSREETACKIVRTGNVFFASAGITSDVISGYTVADQIRSVVEANGTLQTKAKRIVERVKEPLRKHVENILRHDPALLQKMPEPLQIALATIENQKPVLVFIVVQSKQGADGSVSIAASIESCPENCHPGEIRMLGTHEAIEKELKRNRSLLENRPEDYTISLIEIESKSSENVKPPIDVLRITRNGSEWIQKKEDCPY